MLGNWITLKYHVTQIGRVMLRTSSVLLSDLIKAKRVIKSGKPLRVLAAKDDYTIHLEILR
jgi:hypothetical protein